MKVKNDYKNMLNFTEQLSHGHFDTEIEDDLGIFNSMRDRLNNLKTGFEAAVKEETKSQNMKTELITNVSHDLKTPLTCIKNYVILLKKNIQIDSLILFKIFLMFLKQQAVILTYILLI